MGSLRQRPGTNHLIFLILYYDIFSYYFLLEKVTHFRFLNPRLKIQENNHYRRRSLMGHGRRRPVPLKHSKTCDSFNEKSSSGTPLIEEELARKEEVPVKKSKIWPLRNY